MQEPPNTDWNLELAGLGRKAFKIVLTCQHCEVAKNSSFGYLLGRCYSGKYTHGVNTLLRASPAVLSM
jgi:hypothetical protein